MGIGIEASIDYYDLVQNSNLKGSQSPFLLNLPLSVDVRQHISILGLSPFVGLGFGTSFYAGEVSGNKYTYKPNLSFKTILGLTIKNKYNVSLAYSLTDRNNVNKGWPNWYYQYIEAKLGLSF
jgi:hypothetical protein